MPSTRTCITKLLLLSFALLGTLTSKGQNIAYQQSFNAYHPDKLPMLDTTLRHKRFGRSAIEFGFAELTPWAYDHFIAKKDYANISLKTIGHNLEPNSWTWDNDPFETNQFGHPYHGNYFFNTFRTNGYNFWQSSAAAFAGSYVWESYAENQPPAPNDFINTGFGGTILGEMTYRMSNKIVNNRATGLHRQVSEVVALLVDPVNGLNRILDGKWGKVYGNPTERDSSKISAQFDAGFRQYNLTSNNPFHNTEKGWYAHARLLYGVPDENYKTPFSNFIVNIEVGKDDSTSLNIISVYGSLIGWDLSWEGKSQQLIVISANYDYINNASFFYGGQSIKFNWISTYKFTRNTTLRTNFGAGPTLLAAVPDPYLFRGRNYDYGSGFGVSAGGSITIDDKLMASLNYRGGWVATISGNTSNYFLHTASAELSYMFVKDISFCTELGYYALEGNYSNHPDRDEHYPYFKAALRYNIDF